MFNLWQKRILIFFGHLFLILLSYSKIKHIQSLTTLNSRSGTDVCAGMNRSVYDIKLEIEYRTPVLQRYNLQNVTAWLVWAVSGIWLHLHSCTLSYGENGKSSHKGWKLNLLELRPRTSLYKLIKPRQLCWAGFIAMLMCVCVCVSVCVCIC